MSPRPAESIANRRPSRLRCTGRRVDTLVGQSHKRDAAIPGRSLPHHRPTCPTGRRGRGGRTRTCNLPLWRRAHCQLCYAPSAREQSTGARRTAPAWGSRDEYPRRPHLAKPWAAVPVWKEAIPQPSGSDWRLERRSAMTRPMQRAQTARASLAIDWAAALAYGLGALLVGVLASTDGGYFPESWAWLSALTLFPALIVLLASDRVRLSRPETAFLILLLAFGCWVMLSATWSVSVTSTVLEAERVLAYFGTTLLLLLVVTRRTAPFLLAGSLAGTGVVATYALLTRVLPDRFAGFDSAAGYRLSDPLGYWNGLGIFCAMGTLMALGLAARARSPLARAFFSALPVILVATLYFTFSRGAWIALAFGLAVTIAVDPRRLRLVLTGIALAPWSILAVWLASRSDALTVIGAPLSDAASEGHALLRAILLLSIVSGAAGLSLAYADRRVPTERTCGAHLRRSLARARRGRRDSDLGSVGIAAYHRGEGVGPVPRTAQGDVRRPEQPSVRPLLEWPAAALGRCARRVRGTPARRTGGRDLRVLVGAAPTVLCDGSGRTLAVRRDARRAWNRRAGSPRHVFLGAARGCGRSSTVCRISGCARSVRRLCASRRDRLGLGAHGRHPGRADLGNRAARRGTPRP